MATQDLRTVVDEARKSNTSTQKESDQMKAMFLDAFLAEGRSGAQSLRRRGRQGRSSRSHSGAARARYTSLPSGRCPSCQSLSGAPTAAGNIRTNVVPSVSRGQGSVAATSPRRNDSHIGGHRQIAGCLSSVDRKICVCPSPHPVIWSGGEDVDAWVWCRNTQCVGTNLGVHFGWWWLGARAHCAARVLPCGGVCVCVYPCLRTLRATQVAVQLMW